MEYLYTYIYMMTAIATHKFIHKYLNRIKLRAQNYLKSLRKRNPYQKNMSSAEVEVKSNINLR